MVSLTQQGLVGFDTEPLRQAPSVATQWAEGTPAAWRNFSVETEKRATTRQGQFHMFKTCECSEPGREKAPEKVQEAEFDT